jgi:hypothetical protein
MFLIYIIVALAAFILGFTSARVFDSRFDKLQDELLSEIKKVKGDVQQAKGGIKL